MLMPPGAVAAEQAILGGVLLDNSAWPAARHLVASDFSRRDHQLIFSAIAHQFEHQLPADAVTVAEYLDTAGQLEDAGGLAYLATLARETPSTANVAAYAAIIAQQAKLRLTHDAARDVLRAGSIDEAATVASRLVELARPSVQQNITLRSAAEIASNPIPAAWLLRPHLEQMVLALLYGELGTLKSFVTLDMLLHIAAGKAWAGSTFRPKPQPTVYISAEGRGLSKRLQAWSLRHRIELSKLPFYAIERALDLASHSAVGELAAAIEALGISPAVIAVDTLSRNCGPLDENSTADMGGFVNALDQHLRQRLKCSVILVHHTGHTARDRARGSYSLMASTDANYRVERPDPEALTIKLTTGRLKDSESPPPIYLEAHVVSLGTTDEDGETETSLVLLPTDQAPPEPKRKPSGKQQAALLLVLESEHNAGNTVWSITEVRKIARERCGMSKSSAYMTVTSLPTGGFLKQTIGGLCLGEPPK